MDDNLNNALKAEPVSYSTFSIENSKYIIVNIILANLLPKNMLIFLQLISHLIA